jgi:hypothetical protein
MLLVPVTCCEFRVRVRFIFPAPMLNLVGRKFKDNRNVKKIVTRWLITQDTDGLIQQAVKTSVSRYDKRLACGGNCVEN